jgi:hypothetical protein
MSPTGAMTRTTIIATVAALTGLFASPAFAQDDPAARVAAARERLAAIERRSTRVADVNAIENLQRSYGYYTDKMLWDHVVDLFADGGTLEIGDSGVYVGKDSIRRYLLSLSDGEQGPLEGVLYNHLQLQPIVTVADDGQSAQGRWRALLLTGTHGSGSGGNWGEGVYENTYVNENGVWKIATLRWYGSFISPYEGGWLDADPDAIAEYSRGRGVEPDRPPSGDHDPYPAADIVPFHYPNPVTGQPFRGAGRGQ